MSPTGGRLAGGDDAGRICRLDRCSHGNVHLNLGDLTLRVGADDLAELARALQIAAARIEADRAPSSRLVCGAGPAKRRRSAPAAPRG